MKIHAENTGNDGRRHKDHRHNREYFDNLVLFDVDKTQGGIEEKVESLGKKGVVRQEGFDIFEDFVDGTDWSLTRCPRRRRKFKSRCPSMRHRRI